MTTASAAPVAMDPNDPFGFRAALQANQPKVAADQAKFLANSYRNTTLSAASREDSEESSSSRRHQKRQSAAATTEAVNSQAGLFGRPVGHKATLSPEQMALKRQRLTTTYDPLSPPDDDPTTAEGVRMGAVTDQDGRHWRQQVMRLGRWVAHSKDMKPFASEPVDVDELTKGEKYWLDIKFRRRIPVRRTPIKMSLGRGCTGRYWALRNGKRVVQSRRLQRPPRNPSPVTPSSHNDDGLGDPSGPEYPFGPDHDHSDFSRPLPRPDGNPPPGSDHQPLKSSGFTRPARNTFASDPNRERPWRRIPLVNGVLTSLGIETVASGIMSRLEAVITDQVLESLPEFAMADDLPASIHKAMADVLIADGVLPFDAQLKMGSVQQPKTVQEVQQAAKRAQKRRQFEREILDSIGVSHNDMPAGFFRDLNSNLVALQDAGQEFSNEFRAQMTMFARAASYPDVDVTATMAGNRTIAASTGTSKVIDDPPVFVDAAQAAFEQKRYWSIDDRGRRISARSMDEQGYIECSPAQMQKIRFRSGDDLSSGHEWVVSQHRPTGVRFYVREDRFDYVAAGCTSPDHDRLVALRLRDGMEVSVKESDISRIPERSEAVILGCDPEVSALENPSPDLVEILQGDRRINVPCNKLGNYINAVVKPPPPQQDLTKVSTLLPDVFGNEDVISETLVGTLPERAHAFKAGCNPAIDVSKSVSQTVGNVPHDDIVKRMPDDEPVSYMDDFADAPDDSLRIPVCLGRTIDLKQRNGDEINIPVSHVDNFRYGGATIIRDSNPPATHLEQLSGRKVWVSQETGEGVSASFAIDDNHLGCYNGSTVSEPTPTLLNRTVRLRETVDETASLPVAQVSNVRHQGGVIVDTEPAYDSREMPSGRLVHISISPDMMDIAVHDNQLGRYPGATIVAPPQTNNNAAAAITPGHIPINQNRLVVLVLSDGRQVKVPVGSVSTEHYQGAKIIRTIPGRIFAEPSSTRTIQLLSKGVYIDVPDNELGLHRGWLIFSAPDAAAAAESRPDTLRAHKGALTAGADNAETNADFPAGLYGPECILPTRKPFPHGRPDKNGNLPQPRPPRGDPVEAERRRQYHEKLVRQDAVREYIAANAATTSIDDECPRLDSPDGSVTVRADSTPGTPPPRSKVVVSATPKRARVEQAGRAAEAGRNVRFGPLPTEEEVGRSPGSGLRTRSGALYGAQRRRGRGSGSGNGNGGL